MEVPETQTQTLLPRWLKELSVPSLKKVIVALGGKTTRHTKQTGCLTELAKFSSQDVAATAEVGVISVAFIHVFPFQRLGLAPPTVTSTQPASQDENAQQHELAHASGEEEIGQAETEETDAGQPTNDADADGCESDLNAGAYGAEGKGEEEQNMQAGGGWEASEEGAEEEHAEDTMGEASGDMALGSSDEDYEDPAANSEAGAWTAEHNEDDADDEELAAEADGDVDVWTEAAPGGEEDYATTADDGEAALGGILEGAEEDDAEDKGAEFNEGAAGECEDAEDAQPQTNMDDVSQDLFSPPTSQLQTPSPRRMVVGGMSLLPWHITGEPQDDQAEVLTPFTGATERMTATEIPDVGSDEAEEEEEEPALIEAESSFKTLLAKWMKAADQDIDIQQISALGTLRTVTEVGKIRIRKSFDRLDILPEESFTVRELQPSELMLRALRPLFFSLTFIPDNGQPEYECVDGNHRLAVLQDMNWEGTWRCTVLKPGTPRSG